MLMLGAIREVMAHTGVINAATRISVVAEEVDGKGDGVVSVLESRSR